MGAVPLNHNLEISSVNTFPCRLIGLLGALLGLTLTTGCATITRGSTDTLVIESEPTGAEIKLSNGMSGKTPATFTLPRKDALVVKIQKAGYEPVEVNITPQISGAGGAGMAGNVLVGGLIGAAVDAGSGAMNDLLPNPVRVNLAPLDGAALDDSGLGVEARLLKLRALKDAGAITATEYRRQRAEILRKL